VIPFPDPVVISLLANLPVLSSTVDDRVSTELDDRGILPALRITKVTDREPPTYWEATPIYQVEVWAQDEFQAGSIAWEIKNHWPTAVREVVGDALVHGRWVDSDPHSSPDPQTDLPRYLMTVGIRLSGAN
jgi:hypothetical protein